MKEIEQVISRYLEEKDTDYAVMITGEWGCGKTYYAKHGLSDIIKNQPYLLMAGKEYNYSSVYVSLYGMSNIKELPFLIVQTIHPFWKGKIAAGIKSIVGGTADFFGVGKGNIEEFVRAFEIDKDKVLIFDDLERVNSESVKIKEILGAINHYADDNNLKVIVISDESKINDDDFQSFKEKTIRYTLKFQKPLSESFDDIVSEKEKDECFAFLKEQKDLIIKVFELGECKNLRTLKFIIDAFRGLFDRVKKAKYVSEILKDLLVSMLVYSIEFKNGEKAEDLKQLSKMTSYLGWIHNEGEDRQKEPEYIDRLWKKYNEINGDYHFYPVINEYVANGYLNEKEIDSLIIELEKKYEKLEETSEGRLFKKICDWKLIKDNEFVEILDQVLIAVKECKYSVEELTQLYYLLLKLEYYGIESFKLTDEIENTFKESIKTVMQRTGFDLYIETKLYYYTPNNYSKELDERYENYLSIIGEYNRELRKKSDQSIIDGFMEELLKNNADKIVEYNKGPFCQFLFENLDPKAVSKALFVANVETVESFRKGVYYRYPDGIVVGQLSSKEKSFLYGLYDEISSFIENQHPRKLSSVWYQLIVKKIEKVLRQYGVVKEAGNGTPAQPRRG